MRQAIFFEKLENAVLNGNRQARADLKDDLQKSRMCFEDYIKSQCGIDASTPQPAKAAPRPRPVSRPEPEEDFIPKAHYQTVRNVRSEDTIDKAINIMLDSGWDFRDPRHKLAKTPEEVKGFLEQRLIGRAVSFAELAGGKGSPQGLFGIIVDSWLDWANRVGVR